AEDLFDGFQRELEPGQLVRQPGVLRGELGHPAVQLLMEPVVDGADGLYPRGAVEVSDVGAAHLEPFQVLPGGDHLPRVFEVGLEGLELARPGVGDRHEKTSALPGCCTAGFPVRAEPDRKSTRLKYSHVKS